MKKIWILMFTVIFLIALLNTQSQPVTGTIGDTGSIIYQQHQQTIGTIGDTSVDLIANDLSVIFILVMSTIFFTTALFARRLRRSPRFYMALGPGI